MFITPIKFLKENPLLENIKDEMIVLIGDTVIDALFDALVLISDIEEFKIALLALTNPPAPLLYF